MGAIDFTKEDYLTSVVPFEYIEQSDNALEKEQRKALVTEPLKEICESASPPQEVIAIGPPIMMKFCAATTRPFGIHTVVSLNTIMIDGTGMCGCCRVTVDGNTKFVCVDGPEFDGHLVDFDNMMTRMKAFKEREDHDRHVCRIGLSNGSN